MRTLDLRSPFSIFDDLERELFRNVDGEKPVSKALTYENDKAYFVSVDLPGVKKKDLDIKIEDGFLTVGAERKSRFDESSVESRFNRTYKVPDDVNIENIEAHLEDGVLTLVLLKEVKPEPKKIEISVNEETNEQARGWRKLLGLPSNKED